MTATTVTRRGGEFFVRADVHGSPSYPMKGGQGDYQPETVMLGWVTETGASWMFRHAVITGRVIEGRTGRPGMFSTSQTIYLNDPGYSECTPQWLAGLVVEMAPGIGERPVLRERYGLTEQEAS
ncbi:hypothetical protein K1W54_29740 [Micromonospora sp. CPCC 205371]|nr:hypothetical protein [Micromonospora sp. CPCC 205371]